MARQSSQYILIYENVRKNIIDGVYLPGSKLPSKRLMAEKQGVSVITIEHAYELLMEEGYITPKEKSGYFVTFDPGYMVTAGTVIQSTPVDIITSESNDVSYDEEDSVKAPDFSYNIYAKTVRRVLNDYSKEIFLRSPGSGTVILRKAIAGYLARSRQINVLYDQIIIGSGAEYLYGLIVQAWGRDIVYGIEDPSYLKIEQVYRANGVMLDKLPMDSDGIISSRLWESEAGILHISPYKSYPSRVTASAAKKREYLRWSSERDAIIIEDDYESEFTPSRKPEETIFSLDKEGRVIYVNTFTCTIGPAIRTAYMVIPRSMKPILREKIGFYSCPVPTLDQYVLASVIDNGDFERHINRVRRNNRRK